MASRDTQRDLQQRCARLTEEAARLQRRGRGEQALTFYNEALDIAGKLARANPADTRPIRQQAGIFNAIGALHTDARRWEAAVTALDEAEKEYRDLAARGVSDVEPLIAEVRARRARAKMIGGKGATAVLELDEAVTSQRRLRAAQPTAQSSLELARILTFNAVVLNQFGDPDLAVASADQAIRLYMSAADAINAAPDLDFQFGYFQAVADVAARIHAAAGDLDRALQADDLAIHATRALANAGGSASQTAGLATRLIRKGMHLSAAGQPGRQDEAASCLEEGLTLDTAAARQAMSDWEESAGREPPVTLASALQTAARSLGRDRVRRELLEAVTAPAAEGRIVSPSDRCAADTAPTWATELAGIAVDLLPRSGDAGLRIGLEAHYLYAVASRHNPPALRHQFDSSGVAWARLLLACGQHLDGRNEDWALPLALDLASWNFGVIVQLQPFVMTVQRYLKTGQPPPGDLDTGVVPLVRDCLSLHAQLHRRNGDEEGAQQLTQIAKLLGMTL
jgi:tetratricopeptide (TPR) repeat protein